MSTQTGVFGWSAIVRLGLVQACLGAMVVLATSTLNRIMVVELALPALVPGLLVGFHYAIQMVRPRMGFGADRGRRCTPWMIGGVVTLALGGTLAAWGTIRMADTYWSGLLVCLLAFGLIGLGVSLLVIVRFVIPGILSGYDPKVIAGVGAFVIMVTTLYLAHGINLKTTVAMVAVAVVLVFKGIDAVPHQWIGVAVALVLAVAALAMTRLKFGH